MLGHSDVVNISAATVHDLKPEVHLTDFRGLLLRELFAFDNLGNWRGWVSLVAVASVFAGGLLMTWGIYPLLF